MDTKFLARGGLLTAAAVALLYLGGVSPWIGAAAAIAAGVCSAVPLLRRGRVRWSVLMYVAASVLSALIVPRKGLVIAYIGFAGLYPILKYLIEARAPRSWQRMIKLLYFNAILAAAVFAVSAGLLPQAALPGKWRLIVIWIGLNAVFEIYDIGLSRLIATLRRNMPL